MISVKNISNILHVKEEEITITETIANCIFRFKCSNNNQIIQLFNKCFNGDFVNYNDTIELKIVNIENHQQKYIKKLEEIDLSDFDTNDQLKIDITIKKDMQKSDINIYSLNKFLEWMFEKDLNSVLESLNALKKRNNEHIYFICLNENINLVTKYFTFQNKKISTLEEGNSCTKKRISNVKSDTSIDYLPEDFTFTHAINDDSPISKKIADYFNKMKTLLSIIYISDFVKIDKDCMTMTINGPRVIEENIEYKFIEYNENLYNIYMWIYTEGNTEDKIEIAKSIICLKCRQYSLLSIDENVMSAIISNYKLYLKDNIKDYLQLKKDLLTNLKDFSNNISNEINKFSNGFKGNLIAILGYIATLYFSTKSNEAFSKMTFYVSEAVLIVSIIILLISSAIAVSRYKFLNNCIDSLNESYSDVLDEQELKKIIELNSVRMKTNKNFWIMTAIIGIAWLLIILALFIGLSLFKNTYFPPPHM